MKPKDLGLILERLGGYLIIVGGCCIAGIFLTVLVNGTWPDFLDPIKNRAAVLSDVIGDMVLIVWGLVFFGPGLIVQWVGRWLQEG